MLKPLARRLPPTTLPMGSGKAATCSKPSAIPAMRSGVSLSLSNMEVFMPFAAAASISTAFAAKISSCLSKRACAIANIALFLIAVLVMASLPAAFFAAAAFALTNS